MVEQRMSIGRMEEAINVFGSFDENIRLIESELHVAVTNRDGELKITGEAAVSYTHLLAMMLPAISGLFMV